MAPQIRLANIVRLTNDYIIIKWCNVITDNRLNSPVYQPKHTSHYKCFHMFTFSRNTYVQKQLFLECTSYNMYIIMTMLLLLLLMMMMMTMMLDRITPLQADWFSCLPLMAEALDIYGTSSGTQRHWNMTKHINIFTHFIRSMYVHMCTTLQYLLWL